MLNVKLGSTALGARFAGLGVATALALSVSVVPGIALADEADATAVTEPAPIEQVVATDADSVVEAADAVLPATEEATALEAAETTEQAEPTTEPASPETTPETNGEATDSEKTTTEVTDDPATKGEEDVKPAAEEDPKGSEETGADAQKDSAEKQATESDATKTNAAEVADATKADATKTTEDATVVATTEAARNLQNVYRMYNPNSGEHFYTANQSEALHLFNVGWRWEGIAYEADKNSGTPVYRVYNPNAGNHFYTTNRGEADHLVSVGWRREGIAWYATGNTLLYRLYNRNSRAGEHLYTTSASERDSVIRAGWVYEGTAWSVVKGYIPMTARWAVSPAWGGTERYWIQSNGQIAKNRIIEPSEGSGYRAYATSSGAVVRNRTNVGGAVMFADNDGRLKNISKTGWLVTDAFSGGLQRYYIVNLGNGALAAKTGWFNVGGTRYYGYYYDGFVARNTVLAQNGNSVYEADNDGRLHLINNYKSHGYKYAMSIGSPTGWFIYVNRAQYKTLVFQKYSTMDPWIMRGDFDCGLGRRSAQTWAGLYRIQRKRPFIRYASDIHYYLIDYIIIDDEAQSFHSVLYAPDGSDRIVSNGIRQNLSSGCIRLYKPDVKFMYDNCPIHTPVRIE